MTQHALETGSFAIAANVCRRRASGLSQRVRGASLVLLALCTSTACAGRAPALRVPARPSFTDGLLAATPADPDLLVELHLDRLRENPTVGPFLKGLAGRPGVASALGFDPLGEADGVVLAVYGIGGGEGQLLVLLRGQALDAPSAARKRSDAEALDAHTLAIGPPTLRTRALTLARDGGQSVLSDEKTIKLRDMPMPEAAPGASIRITARPSFQARVAISSRTGWEEVPEQLSAWVDVADDLAVVAVWVSEDDEAADRLVARLETWSKAPVLAPFGRALWQRTKIERQAAASRLTCVVGPKALAHWREQLGAPPAAPSEPASPDGSVPPPSEPASPDGSVPPQSEPASPPGPVAPQSEPASPPATESAPPPSSAPAGDRIL